VSETVRQSFPQVKTGTPAEVYNDPGSPFVADFIGAANVIVPAAEMV
jgi:ABC-type Fe3+/spermidine/putrescine transport system ATPase subunit